MKKIIKKRLNDSKRYPGYPEYVQKELVGKVWELEVIKVTSRHVHLSNELFDELFLVSRTVFGYRNEEKRLLIKMKHGKIITAEIHLERQKDGRWDFAVSPVEKPPSEVIEKIDYLCKENKTGKLYQNTESYFTNIEQKKTFAQIPTKICKRSL